MRLASARHGSHRTYVDSRRLAAALLLLLLLCCDRSGGSLELVSPPPRTLRQCLHLDEDVGPEEACPASGRPHVRLRFCDAYALAHLLPEGAPCDRPLLARLRGLDERACRATDAFRRLLDRYDCVTANSVSWTCDDCEEAYKQWVCAMYLSPVQVEGREVKPCRYMCRLVEQRCPYFHPSVKEQYAGERVFKCIDPDIPDLEDIQAASAYGPPGHCYCPEHLDADEGWAGEAECRLLPISQLRRNASRQRGHRSGGAPGRPPSSVASMNLMMVLASLAWWTRTR